MGITHEKFAVSFNDKEKKTLFWILIQFLPTSVKKDENNFDPKAHFFYSDSKRR